MKNQRGFSLLEVMIALAILAVSLLALFNLQSTSLIGSARAQRIAVSTMLAQKKMSEVLLELESGIQKGEFPDGREETGIFEEEDYLDYSWKVTIKKTELPSISLSGGESDIVSQVFSQISEQLSELSREVTLTIYWTEFEEEQEGVSVTTHIVRL